MNYLRYQMVECLIAQNLMMKTINKERIVFASPRDFDKKCFEPLNSLIIAKLGY